MLAFMIKGGVELKGVCVWWSLDGQRGDLQISGVMFRHGGRLGLEGDNGRLGSNG